MSNDKADVEGRKDEAALWRLDETETYSDWTIIVKYTSEGDSGVEVADETSHAWKQDTYNVHRVFVGYGKRRCRYFEGIFTSQSFIEGKTKTTEVVVHEAVAKAFPVFLDFVYNGDDALIGRNEHLIVPLRWLAKYFDCDDLIRVLDVLTATLELEFEELMPQYRLAKQLCDEDVLGIVFKEFRRLMLDEVGEGTIESEAEGMDRDFVTELLPTLSPPKAPKTNYSGYKDSRWRIFAETSTRFFIYLRILLVTHCEDQVERNAIWNKHTCTKSFPHICHPKLAVELLRQASLLTGDGLGDTMTELQERCVQDLKKSGISWTRWKADCDVSFRSALQRNHSTEFSRQVYEFLMDLS